MGFAPANQDATQTENLPSLPNQDPPEQIDRELALIENLVGCKTIREAGLRAGFSETYCKSELYNKVKSQRFLKRIQEYYKANASFLLPKILHAESKVIDLVVEDPEKLPKFRHTLKEIKQTAGVLQQDADSQRAPVIQVGHVRQLMVQIRSDLGLETHD